MAIAGPDVLAWNQRLEALQLDVSPEGAAVLASLQQAEGLEDQTVVAVMTGRSGAAATEGAPERTPVSLSSYLEVRSWLEDRLGLEPT